MTQSIAVILPVFNKKNSIPVVYDQVCSTLLDSFEGVRFRMIFVDDASTDGSTGILRNLQQADERVMLIELPRNVGQLKAMEIGLRHATEDIIVFTSSDTQNPIGNIAVLCKAIMNGHDLAIGYRAATTERDVSSYLSRGFYGVLRFFIVGMPSGGFDMGAVDRSMADKLSRLDFAKIAMQAEALRSAKNPFYAPIIRNTDKLDHSNWRLGQKILYALKFVRHLNWRRVLAIILLVCAILVLIAHFHLG